MFAELVLGSVALSVLKGITLFVSYIENNTFLQPLSGPDEAHYLNILSVGKTELSTLTHNEIEEARNTLVEHNLRLVAHLAKKYDGTGVDDDDLISIGTIGLIKGINTFNPSKGVKLTSYAARCIDNEILMYLRSIKKSKRDVSIYDPIGTDKQGNEISLIDVLGSNEEDISIKIETKSEQRSLLEHVEKLSKREKIIVQLRYGLLDQPRQTQQEVAKSLKISRSYISRIEKKALEKLMKKADTDR